MDKAQLEAFIHKHDYHYWVEHNPIIPDDQYDYAVKELKNIDPNNPLVKQIHTPEVTSNNKIKHQIPMLSLDKSYSPQELFKWCKKISRNKYEKFKIEPKLDGWSAKYLPNGYLITRGDGSIGDNISSKLPLITLKTPYYDGPLKDYKHEIIGEVLLSKSMFSKLNTDYKTPRTALSGIMTSDNLLFDFPCLELLSFDYLFDYVVFELNQFDSVPWEKTLEYVKNKLDYPTDGLVVKLLDDDYSKSLGSTSHHPRGQIALKPINPSATSTIIDVNFFVGKDNAIVPVATIQPIQILGHTIQKASLHNYNEFKRLDVHIGDQVLVERCGEIIPQIKQCFPGQDRKKIEINSCPVCESDVYESGYFLYCSNADCLGSLTKRLTDSCKRLGIESIGPAITNRLIDIGVEDTDDVFELTRTEISRISGFKQKSIDNMIAEISRIKNNPIEDWKILASLNITNIGRSISKKILSKYTIKELMNMDVNDLQKIENIGPERASLIRAGLMNNQTLEYFLNNFKIINSKDQNTKKKHTVCFTGKMPEKRSYYEGLAEKNNLWPVNSITKDLDLLVAADLNDNRGKLQKARKLNLNIISLNDFMQYIKFN